MYVYYLKKYLSTQNFLFDYVFIGLNIEKNKANDHYTFMA